MRAWSLERERFQEQMLERLSGFSLFVFPVNGFSTCDKGERRVVTLNDRCAFSLYITYRRCTEDSSTKIGKHHGPLFMMLDVSRSVHPCRTHNSLLNAHT